MTFVHDDHWVWDFWFADDGDRYHLYYLHAPRSLGDPDLRHRNARIGHAISHDLRVWEDHGPVLSPGDVGDFDASATWTGSVVRGDDGLWRMFYTGARFLSPESTANVESIGVATSSDLHRWTKNDAVIVTADPRWYETLPDGTWREEAWRDPWVYRTADGWRMLVTARSAHGDPLDRGVVALATSDDLSAWTVQPPVTAPGAGFMHLEVPQHVEVGDRTFLLFSCDTPHLAGDRAARGEQGGIWAATTDDGSHYLAASATRLLDERYYSGRAIRNRSDDWVLLAFENVGADGDFVGRLSDPMPLYRSGESLAVETELEATR